MCDTWLAHSYIGYGPNDVARTRRRAGLERGIHGTAASCVQLVGLYVANFLTLAVAVMLPVDSLSGEIESGVMETIASK
ncbi:MAG TPA: hypothetical protein VNY82_15390, partial [Steroidobacteraceae bacterium]|nr:hypothetical protein [Steroidobacteraceae bacterium]